MNNLYEKIYSLCMQRGIKPGKMCNDLAMSRSTITDLKMGRIETLSSATLSKIANYFSVTVDYLLTGEEKEKAPTNEGERSISDDDLKFALWGSTDMDDGDLDDVRRYAAFVKANKEQKKK